MEYFGNVATLVGVAMSMVLFAVADWIEERGAARRARATTD